MLKVEYCKCRVSYLALRNIRFLSPTTPRPFKLDYRILQVIYKHKVKIFGGSIGPIRPRSASRQTPRVTRRLNASFNSFRTYFCKIFSPVSIVGEQHRLIITFSSVTQHSLIEHAVMLLELNHQILVERDNNVRNFVQRSSFAFVIQVTKLMKALSFMI